MIEHVETVLLVYTGLFLRMIKPACDPSKYMNQQVRLTLSRKVNTQQHIITHIDWNQLKGKVSPN